MPLPSFATLFESRVLFVFAHPGDETSALGGILNRFRDPWFACLTDGAPQNESYARAAGCANAIEYGRLRRRELAIALALAGHDSERLLALGFADQELAHSLEGITQAVEVLLQRVQPDYVITHPYEGGHPDHDATAFAVHTAVAATAEHHASPTLLEMTGYHSRDGQLVTGEFLPLTGDQPLVAHLTPAQRAQKQQQLAAHRSQAAAFHDAPLDREFIRVAPRYDFTHAPHDGRLHYENFPWSVTPAEWRRAAVVALERLHLSSLATAAY